MFRKVSFKLCQLHRTICKLYSSLIVDRPFLLIVSYIFIFFLFSFGFFNLKVNQENDSLMFVKNSQFLKNQQKMIENFPVNYSNYLLHMTPDLGHYVEFILKLKPELESQKNGILNATILAEYNYVFDQVFELKARPGLSYIDLCPLRIEKCAVEAGVLRHPIFQRDFVQLKTHFTCGEPGLVYMNQEVMDGTSFEFAFGTTIKYQKEGDECYVTGASLVRNRFSLRNSDETEKKNAIAFMEEFVKLMPQLEKGLKYLDMTYFASQLQEKVVIEYSLEDVRFVALSFVFFWAIFALLVLFDFKSVFSARQSYSSDTFEENEEEDEQKESYLSSKMSGLKTICLDGSSLLVLAAFVQFILTIFSTVGLISIFSIELNQLLVYYPLILMSKYLLSLVLAMSHFNKEDFLL